MNTTICTCTWLNRLETKLLGAGHGTNCQIAKEVERIRVERDADRKAEVKRLIAELEDACRPNEHPVYRYRLLRARYLDRKRGAA